MQGFRMSYEQVASGRKASTEPGQYALLCGAVEIDDDVATKDGIDRLGNTVVRVHKVQTTKLNLVAHLGHDTQALLGGVAAA
jgi:hypothetical protein